MECGGQIVIMISQGNNALFDQVYQPLRAHYLSSLFNNASPTEAQVDTAVDNILRDGEFHYSLYYRPFNIVL